MTQDESTRVGVVVAAFNAEHWLGETLESLLAQTCQDWECVVVDDGSSDATVEVAQRFQAQDARIRLVSQPNAGVSAARNAGTAQLSDACSYIAFLDSDDLYLPDALAVLLALAQARPDAVGAYGLADFIDEHSRPLEPGLHSGRQRNRRTVVGRRLHDLPSAADTTFATLAVAAPIWPPAVAVLRIDAVRAAGGFDESFTSQEDWDLYLRLSRTGPFAFVDRVIVGYRRHAGNATSAHYSSVLQQERVRHDAYRSVDNTVEQRAQVRDAWRYLGARQTAQLARHVVRNARAGHWRAAGNAAVGSAVSAVTTLRPGPPAASERRVRHTQLEDLPDNQLLNS